MKNSNISTRANSPNQTFNNNQMTSHNNQTNELSRFGHSVTLCN